MKKAATVEEYLEQVPEPQRTTLGKMRTLIRAAAPKDATEGLSYGMPAFFHNGALVCYAAFKNHCSFFPMSGRLVEEFAADVAKFKTSKGTVQFAVDRPLPATLVKKFVKARVSDNEAKKKKKKS